MRPLLQFGAHVVALAHSAKPDSQFFLKSFDDLSSVSLYWGDIADQALIERIFARHPIDVFFHAAYGADVHRVLDEPLECFRSSAISTWQILDFLRVNHPNCISVISSTDKVYGRQPIPYREDYRSSRPPIRSRKGRTRSCCPKLWRVWELPVAITRCGNFFGGYDFNFSRLIPGVVQSILQGKVPRLRSNGRFTRDFLYIESAVDAQLLLAQRLSEDDSLYGEAFNFSYGEHVEVLDIVQRICRLLDVSAKVVVNENNAVEIPNMQLSCTKAEQRLGFKPSYNFTTGLERTVNWYREHFIMSSVQNYNWLERTTVG